MKKKNSPTKNRIVVITGASSGIGQACKQIFEEHGDTVVCLSRTNPDNFANFFPCDVANAKQVKDVFSAIKLKFGHIDVLINNAGHGLSGAVELTDDEDIKNIFDVNLLGVINCYKNALPQMSRGAKIINISSACALFPLPFRSLYCASKAGVQMLSLSLNMECKPLGISVLSVCPGDVKTNFTAHRVKIFETNERYGARISNAARSIDERQDKRMSVNKVACVVYKYSTKKHPKPYIIVGGKYKLLQFAMRFAPTRWLLFFTEKFFGGHKAPVQKGSPFGKNSSAQPAQSQTKIVTQKSVPSPKEKEQKDKKQKGNDQTRLAKPSRQKIEKAQQTSNKKIKIKGEK
jgi:short-subunit dehydrogenase